MFLQERPRTATISVLYHSEFLILQNGRFRITSTVIQPSLAVPYGYNDGVKFTLNMAI